MGDFGIHLYENDFALDIKGEYEEGLRNGVSNDKLTKNMIKKYSDEKDDYYQMMFWVILADVQNSHCMLLDKVRERALYYLNTEEILNNNLNEVSAIKDIRKKELLDVKERINAGFIETDYKKITKETKIYQCTWNIGDVYEYQIHNNTLYRDQYIYFVKCGEDTWYPGHICPILYFFSGIYSGQQSLSNLIKNDFMPIPLVRAHDIDENLFKYKVLLITTSKRVVPQKYLKYLGNMGLISNIYNEDLDSSCISIRWKDIETYFINAWVSWRSCFDNNKMIEAETHKFRGRIPENEEYVRLFYRNMDYKIDNDVWKWSSTDNSDLRRLYPYLWSFCIKITHKEFYDSDRWNGARYQLIGCESKDIFFDCEERNLDIPCSFKDNVYIDIFAAHSKSIYYCDYSADFLCKAFYDKEKNIYVVGDPYGLGDCVEFAPGQYAVINNTKLVSVFVDLNITQL